MKLIDSAGATVDNTFTDGDSGTGVPATVVAADWLNSIQTEMANVVLDDDSGITELSQDNSNMTQLVTAIRAIATVIATDIGGGGGGSGTGTLVKTQEASLGSDHTTTSTSTDPSGVASGSYAVIGSSNQRLITAYVDHSLKDLTAVGAQAFIELQRSPDNSTWTTLKTFEHKSDFVPGKIQVNTSKVASSTDASTNSTTNVTITGLQNDYTANVGSNTRLIQFYVNSQAQDSSGGGAHSYVSLQYYNGSTWVDLQVLENQQVTNNQVGNTQQISMFYQIEHNVTDDTPQYRVVHKAASGDTSTVLAGSFINVIELQPMANNEQRMPIFFIHRDTTSGSTWYYRIAHKVTSGDTSIVRAGSLIRVQEFN